MKLQTLRQHFLLSCLKTLTASEPGAQPSELPVTYIYIYIYIHINDVMQMVGSALCKVMQSKIYNFKFKN